MVHVGQKAPDFACEAVVDGKVTELSLGSFTNRYKVLFFYPLDFTFVCPTELHAFQQELPEFEKRNVQVIGASVDSVYSHHAWLKTPKKNGGIEGITYPLLSDMCKEISRAYGVLDEKAGVALRGIFIIDKDNVVQSMTVNNLGLGRNVAEILRTIDALQHHEKHGEVCPANWASGEKALEPTAQGVKNYFNGKA